MDCFENTRHHCSVFRARKIRETMLAPVKRFYSVLQTSNGLTMVVNLNELYHVLRQTKLDWIHWKGPWWGGDEFPNFKILQNVLFRGVHAKPLIKCESVPVFGQLLPWSAPFFFSCVVRPCFKMHCVLRCVPLLLNKPLHTQNMYMFISDIENFLHRRKRSNHPENAERLQFLTWFWIDFPPIAKNPQFMSM